MTDSSSIGPQICGLIKNDPCDPTKVASFLDGLTHEERLVAIRSLGGREQKLLWDAVDGFAALRLHDMVPKTVDELTPVIHHGKNSLPLFSHFQKRFYRADSTDKEHSEELYGHNFSSMMSIIGPGYYVAVNHPSRPEVLIDYRRLPSAKPESWPKIQSNEVWLSRFVYGFMVDTLRRVSKHVTIGSAARNGKDINSWFVLCREDVS